VASHVRLRESGHSAICRRTAGCLSSYRRAALTQ
jgi:hypothetical protein